MDKTQVFHLLYLPLPLASHSENLKKWIQKHHFPICSLKFSSFPEWQRNTYPRRSVNLGEIHHLLNTNSQPTLQWGWGAWGVQPKITWVAADCPRISSSCRRATMSRPTALPVILPAVLAIFTMSLGSEQERRNRIRPEHHQFPKLANPPPK